MAPRRDLHFPSLVILATELLFVGPVGILAQSSTANCLSSFNWMDNSRNQSPCVVAAYLQGACYGGQYTVNGLSPPSQYIGPNAENQNECQCSSVTYNAISACGLCQNSTIVNWSHWYFNCTTIYPGFFSPSIPDGTAVPAWAFQNVTKSDLFDVTLAQAVGDNPESTATRVQSTGSPVAASTTTSAFLTDSPSPSSTSSPISLSKSSNTGAIVGGVVGGIVGVALIAGVVLCFVAKKKRPQILARFAGRPSPSAYLSPGSTHTTPSAPQMTQPTLYDPWNPRTFPTSAPPNATMINSSSMAHNPAISHFAPSLRPGHYNGMPEI